MSTGELGCKGAEESKRARDPHSTESCSRAAPRTPSALHDLNFGSDKALRLHDGGSVEYCRARTRAGQTQRGVEPSEGSPGKKAKARQAKREERRGECGRGIVSSSRRLGNQACAGPEMQSRRGACTGVKQVVRWERRGERKVRRRGGACARSERRGDSLAHECARLAVVEVDGLVFALGPLAHGRRRLEELRGGVGEGEGQGPDA